MLSDFLPSKSAFKDLILDLEFRLFSLPFSTRFRNRSSITLTSNPEGVIKTLALARMAMCALAGASQINSHPTVPLSGCSQQENAADYMRDALLKARLLALLCELDDLGKIKQQPSADSSVGDTPLFHHVVNGSFRTPE